MYGWSSWAAQCLKITIAALNMNLWDSVIKNMSQTALGLFPKILGCSSGSNPAPLQHSNKWNHVCQPCREPFAFYTHPDSSARQITGLQRALWSHSAAPRNGTEGNISGVALKIPTYQLSRNPQRYMDKKHLERRNDLNNGLLCTFNLNSCEGCEGKYFAKQQFANKTSFF